MSWRDLLLWKTDRHGDRTVPVASNANVLVILEHDPELAGLLCYDELADAPMFERAPPWAPAAASTSYPASLTDEDATRFAAWLQARFYTAWNSKNALYDALVATAKARPVNPLTTYLDGLTWDGIERIDFWLTNYLGVKLTEYSQAIAGRWLISAVARAYQPGVQVDCVLVLEGFEGVGKSTVLKTLGGRWFKDEAFELEQSQEMAIALQGVWIWEIPELAGVKGKAWERTKSFVTRRIDNYRPKYGRTTISRPRRGVFAASVNERGYIPDERGARRFWPVACGAVQGIDLEGVARDRDQLWAEAVVRYRAGSPFHLDSEWLRGLQRAEVAERREHHAWEDILAPWLEDLTDGEKERGVTTADALDFLKIPTDRWPSANSQVGRVLRSLGYEQAERPRETTEDGNTRRGKWRWKRKERPAGYIRRIRPRRIDPRQLELFAA